MKKLFVLCAVFSFTSLSATKSFQTKIYPSYSSFSYDLQKKIKNANLRVWVASYAFMDKLIFRELLNSLTKYNVDVRLITNKRNTYPPKSIDFYAGYIPTNIRVFDPPTGILIDDELLFADHTLQNRKNATTIKVIRGPESIIRIFEKNYIAATKNSAVAKRFKTRKNSLPINRTDDSQTFDYNRNSSRFTTPPQEVPQALPKVPLYQKTE